MNDGCSTKVFWFFEFWSDNIRFTFYNKWERPIVRFLYLYPIVVDISGSVTGVALIMLGFGQCNQVRYSHHFSQKAEGKTIVWYKMLTKCIVLIIIIQKRLRIINIYYLFTGVRNDENIKFPWHSPSQMTINFNSSSLKGKVATVQYGPVFFFQNKNTTKESH